MTIVPSWPFLGNRALLGSNAWIGCRTFPAPGPSIPEFSRSPTWADVSLLSRCVAAVQCPREVLLILLGTVVGDKAECALCGQVLAAAVDAQGPQRDHVYRDDHQRPERVAGEEEHLGNEIEADQSYA